MIIKDQQSSNLDGNKSIKDKDKDKNLLNDTLPLTLTKSGITGYVSSKTNSMNISSFSVINGNQPIIWNCSEAKFKTKQKDFS